MSEGGTGRVRLGLWLGIRGHVPQSMTLALPSLLFRFFLSVLDG